MPAGRRHLLVPGRLTIVMRVDVNEARRHQSAGGVNLFSRAAVELARERSSGVVRLSRKAASSARGLGLVALRHFALEV